MAGILIVMVTVNTYSKRKKGSGYNTGMPTPPAACTIEILLLGSILGVLILDVNLSYTATMTQD